jgi:hypothetical protein
MPRIEASAVIPVSIDIAFALSQTYGEVRYRWDPFVREQHLLNGATRAASGAQTYTQSRHRLSMVSQYQAFKPPTHVGFKMVKGPWFFASMSGGWNFTAETPTSTQAVWRYNFVCRPKWMQPISHRLGSFFLKRDIEKRLQAFVAAGSDESIISQLTLFRAVDRPSAEASGNL